MRVLAFGVLCAILAPALLGANLQFGSPIAVSSIRPGDPLSERLVNAWGDGTNVVAVVTRSTFDHHTPVRMSIDPSGRVDPSSVAQLPIPTDSFVAAPFGNATMIVFSDNDGTKAELVDASGHALASPVAIPGISSPQSLVCNATRCAVTQTNRAVLIDGNGHTVATVNGLMSRVVAGSNGFLISHGGQLTLIDNDGKSIATATVSYAQSIVYDGSRFLAAGVSAATSQMVVWSVDPASGAASQAATIDGIAFADWTIDRFSLVASDTGYLALFHVSPPASGGSSAFTATMRFTSGFAPIDSAPQQIASDPTTLSAIGVTGGFHLLAQTGGLPLQTFFSSSMRVSLFSDGGSQAPAAAAASASTILGVFTETAGDHLDLLVSRVDRSGHALAAAPTTLASALSFAWVHAASDGNGFAVVWQDNSGTVGGATVDASGTARLFTIAPNIPPSKWTPRLIAANGAYQLAFASGSAIATATITTDGHATVLTPLAIGATSNSTGVAYFDGRRTIAFWTDGSTIYTATSAGAVSTGQVPRGITVTGVDLAPNGINFLALISTWDQTGIVAGNVTYLNELTSAGELSRGGLGVAVAAAGVAADYRLIPIDGAWYVTWLAQLYSVTGGVERNLAAFDPSTLIAGAKSAIDTGHNFANDVVTGYGGEALLIDADDVPIASGYAAQMTVQSIRGLLAHKRAARR